MSETNHTPKWTYMKFERDGFKFLIHKDGACVASVWPCGDNEETEENAASLVTAVNAHAEIVEALGAIVTAYDQGGYYSDVQRAADFKKARAALAKAKGEK